MSEPRFRLTPPLASGNCQRCGLCLAVCPTYWDSGLETQSPRGRIALIMAAGRGDLAPSANFRDQVYHCLDCRACSTVCPSGVRVGPTVTAARAALTERRRLPLVQSLVLRHLLPHQGRLEASLWPLKAYQRLGLAWMLGHTPASRLLPSAVDAMRQLLPPLAARPLRGDIPEVTPAAVERRYRVGFFLGCAMSLLFPEVSRATVTVLSRHGCDVLTPPGIRCCGAIHESLGDRSTMLDLARHNIAVFERAGVDAIVSDCASCGLSAKEYGEWLADDPTYAARARAYSAKAQDISEFLAAAGLPAEIPPLATRVTYHDPCHLAHGQGVAAQPRALLGRAPGADYRELNEASWCCGSAGLWGIGHAERSFRILDRKMDNVQATGADMLVTANPGCLLQLRLGARRRGLDLPVLHISQVLAGDAPLGG